MDNIAKRHFDLVYKYHSFNFDDLSQDELQDLKLATLLQGQGIVQGYPAPILVLNAYIKIHEYKKTFEMDKNSLALMWANQTVLEYQLIAPEWLSNALVQRINEVKAYEHRSWDVVLGNPVPKGKSLKKLKQEQDLWLEITCELSERKQKGQGFSADLMDEIGEIYGINREKVWEMYKKMKEMGYFKDI